MHKSILGLCISSTVWSYSENNVVTFEVLQYQKALRPQWYQYPVNLVLRVPPIRSLDSTLDPDKYITESSLANGGFLCMLKNKRTMPRSVTFFWLTLQHNTSVTVATSEESVIPRVATGVGIYFQPGQLYAAA